MWLVAGALAFVAVALTILLLVVWTWYRDLLDQLERFMRENRRIPTAPTVTDPVEGKWAVRRVRS